MRLHQLTQENTWKTKNTTPCGSTGRSLRIKSTFQRSPISLTRSRTTITCQGSCLIRHYISLVSVTILTQMPQELRHSCRTCSTPVSQKVSRDKTERSGPKSLLLLKI